VIAGLHVCCHMVLADDDEVQGWLDRQRGAAVSLVSPLPSAIAVM